MGGTQNNKVIPHRYDLCKNLPRQYRFVEKWICLSSCPEISGLELAWLRRHVRSRLPHMVFHPCRIHPHSESRKTWICMTGNLLQVWQPYAGTFSSFFGGVGGVSYKRRFFSTHVHFSCFAYGCVCKSSPCVAASISNVQTNFGRVTELKLGAGRHFKVVGQRTTKNLLWGKKPIEWLATVLFLLIVQNKYKNIVHSAVYYYYSFVV